MATNYIGSDNKVSGTIAEKTALYKKVFINEVLQEWQNKPMLRGLTTIKTINEGESAYFKNSGSASFSQQWDGTVIAGDDAVGFSKTSITIEPRITSTEKITNIDTAMNDFNEREILKEAQLSALANKEDYDKVREIYKGSLEASGAVTGTPGGKVITMTGFDLLATIQEKGTALIDAIYAGKKNYAKKNVIEQAYCLVNPDEYSILELNDKVQNIDFNRGNNGSLNEGGALKVGGVIILESNNLSKVDSSADTYHGADMTQVRALLFTKSSVATVELIGLNAKFVDEGDSYSEKSMISYVEGHGFLRPECSVSIING